MAGPGTMAIAAYRPKPGRDAALAELVRDHVPALRRLGLASDRPAVAMQAKDGTILEVFEWRAGAIAAAHEHPEVQALWQRFAEACDFVPLAQLPEAAEMFAEFVPLEL